MQLRAEMRDTTKLSEEEAQAAEPDLCEVLRRAFMSMDAQIQVWGLEAHLGWIFLGFLMAHFMEHMWGELLYLCNWSTVWL